MGMTPSELGDSSAAAAGKGREVALIDGLRAALRAAQLAMFVIRKQGVMPNGSWEKGLEKDIAIAEAALAAHDEPRGLSASEDGT